MIRFPIIYQTIGGNIKRNLSKRQTRTIITAQQYPCLFNSAFDARKRINTDLPLSLSAASMSTTPEATSPGTADLCDAHVTSPERLTVCEPCLFHDYGGIKSFHGQIETVRCFESNPLVRETLGENGKGRVLVVDGSASKRCAILGDLLAALAHKNDWAGVVVNGCIRDSKVIATIPVGVKALGTHPLKSIKTHRGERGCKVAFGGIEFLPGHWLYADEDGIIVSEKKLELPSDTLP